MIDKDQIEQWLREGTITAEQAQKMLADVSRQREERSSSKLIIALSTIGAILLGIGVILFVASNWERIPKTVVILILYGSTTASFYLGYRLRYEKQTLIRVGASLVFLSALLFGATIFLLAQNYHVNANNHFLILIWLAGIIPVVYALKTEPIAGLSSLLFLLWIGLFVLRNVSFASGADDFFVLPVLYLVSGILLFGIGGLHYLSDDLKGIARVYRIAGIEIAMLALFLLSFRFFSGHYDDFYIREGLKISSQVGITFVIFAVFAVIFTIANLAFSPSRSDTSILEGSFAIGLVVVALLFFLFPVKTNVYVALFNLILVGLVFALLFVGYRREDIRLVNIGMAYLALLVIVRYFDFFWRILAHSIFFMVGGALLVLGGTALERKRRSLKAKFGA